MRTPPADTLRWLSPSPEARRLLWHVFAIGTGLVSEVQKWGALDKPGAQLLSVEAGGAELRLKSGIYELRRGHNFWIYSTQDRLITPAPGPPFVNYGLCFGGLNLEIWLEQMGVAENPEFRFTPALSANIRAQRSRLMRLIQNPTPDWEWEVHRQVNEILKAFLTSRVMFGKGEGLPVSVVRVLNAVAADPARDWKMTELAGIAGLSYTRLRVHFRNAMAETLHQHVQRSRLNVARDLLSDRNLYIKEVAERLHFTNEYYFSTFFRRETGWTPSDFRTHIGVRGSSLKIQETAR